MSEYWKSTPKYWCKHCTTYVKDTPFERKQHENTGKHQGNLKRSLRTIQNDHERGEREKQRAKAEVERLNRVVGGGTSATTSPAAPATVRKTTTAPLNAADQKKQWAQLAQMGIQVPDEFRGEMAMASDWKVSSRRNLDEDPIDETLNVGVRKRKREGQEEEEEAGETVVRKGWGSTTRRYPGHDNVELDDLLSGTINLKKDKASPNSEIKMELKSESNVDTKTEATHHRTESEPSSENKNAGSLGEGEAPPVESTSCSVKEETADAETKQNSIINQIPEVNPLAVFKKRKSKATTS